MIKEKYTKGKFSGANKIQSFQEFSDSYYDALYQSITYKNEFVSQKKVMNAVSILKESFIKNNVNAECFDDKWWFNFIKAASLNDDEGNIIQDDLISDIEKIQPEAVKINDFLHMYSLAVRAGLMVVGFHLRNKARSAAITSISQNAHADFSNFAYGIGALYELNEIYEVEKNINSASVTNPVYLAKERQLRRIFTIHNKNRDAHIETNIDIEFEALLKDKSIAVVGPASTMSLDAQEIDSFDLVVRCNYKEEGIGIDEKIKGLRCDISYFNRLQSEYILNSSVKNFPISTKWLVNRRKEHSDSIQAKLKEEFGIIQSKFRRQYHFSYILFMGHLNAIPNIILDLLCFQPKKIKIFHADLMTSTQHADGYQVYTPTNIDQKHRIYLYSFNKVELLSQFYLLKNLFNKNFIEGDERFSTVMEMDDIEYMSHIQQAYGLSGRFLQMK